MASIFVITIFHIRWRGMRDCGGSYWWIEVNHHGHWGYYVAYACVKFYCDSHDGQEHPEAIAAVQEEGREATVPPTPEPLPKVEG